LDESGKRRITVTLARGGGTTTREAVTILVPGSALLGSAQFPVDAPRLFKGERLRWAAGGWIIEGAKFKRQAR